MRKIAIIGAGGLGREVASIIKNINQVSLLWDIIGFFDDTNELQGINTPYGKVLGTIEDLNRIRQELNVVIAVGKGQGIFNIRQRIDNKNIVFPNIIHPSTMFLDKDTTSMGEGNIFSAQCIVSCGVKIGSYNIFNTRVTLGHDGEIEDYNVFSPNTQISGNVSIGKLNYLGFNCGVIQGKKIGNNNTLAAGAMLFRSVKDGNTYMGNPAIKVKF